MRDKEAPRKWLGQTRRARRLSSRLPLLCTGSGWPFVALLVFLIEMGRTVASGVEDLFLSCSRGGYHQDSLVMKV